MRTVAILLVLYRSEYLGIGGSLLKRIFLSRAVKRRDNSVLMVFVCILLKVLRFFWFGFTPSWGLLAKALKVHPAVILFPDFDVQDVA